MPRKLLILTVIIFSEFSAYSQNPENQPDKISLLFMGDIMGHDEQILSAENKETNTFNYDEVFKYIREEISEADIAIANFEVTLAGPPYKGYPTFSSPAELAVACRDAGIDFFVTANNHAADRGKMGIISTLNKLDSLKIPHTGTFSDKSGRDSLYPLIINKNGKSLALLNYTYGTNGINVPRPAIVNMLDKELIAADIDKAKEKNPDLIILFLHWGTEYDTIPSNSQSDLAEYFFSCGADLIIGSHPHVMQKMIWTKRNGEQKDKVMVYSLGNFVSNQRKSKTDGGAMVRIELEQQNDSLYVTNAGYYLTWVFTPIEKYRKRFYILPCSKFENNPEFFSNTADYKKMNTFITNSRKFLFNQNINFNEFIYSSNTWTR
jgi:poly-gamma-glutamate synthesis protein (capsule biosynthesis protein)